MLASAQALFQPRPGFNPSSVNTQALFEPKHCLNPSIVSAQAVFQPRLWFRPQLCFTRVFQPNPGSAQCYVSTQASIRPSLVSTLVSPVSIRTLFQPKPSSLFKLGSFMGKQCGLKHGRGQDLSQELVRTIGCQRWFQVGKVVATLSNLIDAPVRRLSAEVLLKNKAFASPGALPDSPPPAALPDSPAPGALPDSPSGALPVDWSTLSEKMGQAGFVVLPQLVPVSACEALKAGMFARAQHVLQLMGHALGDDCTGLFKAVRHFDKSPSADWLDSGKEVAWGAFGRRGWIKSTGSGRLFEGGFADEPALLAVQEHTREAVARFHGLEPAALIRQQEKCSIKPPGSPALPPHLDANRRGTYQVGPHKENIGSQKITCWQGSGVNAGRWRSRGR